MDDVFVAMPIIMETLALLEEAGLERAQALARAGLTEDDLDDPDRLIPERAERELWRYIAELHDRGVGLRAGMRIQRGAYAAAEYLMRTSATLGEAIMCAAQYGRLLRSYEVATLSEGHDGELTFTFLRPYEPSTLAQVLSIEASVSIFVALVRDATGFDWTPKQLAFRHAAPDQTDLYTVLSPRVAFEQSRVSLVVAPEDAERPMVEADHALHELLARLSKKRLSELPIGHPTASRVNEVLHELLPHHEPSLAAVAERLELSPRVLQRRLQVEGMTFRGMVEGVREEIARQYLTQTNMTAVDVAMLLDYADAPSFYRAFKRWTGVSPGEFRRRGSR